MQRKGLSRYSQSNSGNRFFSAADKLHKKSRNSLQGRQQSAASVSTRSALLAVAAKSLGARDNQVAIRGICLESLI